MIDAPWYRNSIETNAFNAYAFHSQEVEDVINLIGKGATSVSCDISCDMDMTDNDIRYIKAEVQRRYGLDIDIT